MRRVHNKTRRGCNDCKRRRVKCDEQKPSCKNCIRNKLDCSFEFLVPQIRRSPSTSRQLLKEASQEPQESSLSTLNSKRTSPRAFHPLATADLVLRPPCPLDTKGLELLHHYTVATCATLTAPKAIEVWRTSIPQMAVSHPFLMHGILALSALHLASFQPHRQLELGAMALASEQAALPSYRQIISELDPHNDNIHAVFAFSTFVVPYMLAISGTFEGGIGKIPRQGEPHWFHAIRGWSVLLGNNWKAIYDGPFQPVMGRTPENIEYSFNPDDESIARLHGMLIPSPSASEKEIQDLKVCGVALDEWRRVSAIPYANSRIVTLGVSLFVWPATISEEFIQLIHESRPEALVILAYYCVLLKKLGGIWFLKGAGDRLMKVIVQEVGEEWAFWMKGATDQPSEPLDNPLYQPTEEPRSQLFDSPCRRISYSLIETFDGDLDW